MRLLSALLHEVHFPVVYFAMLQCSCVSGCIFSAAALLAGNFLPSYINSPGGFFLILKLINLPVYGFCVVSLTGSDKFAGVANARSPTLLDARARDRPEYLLRFYWCSEDVQRGYKAAIAEILVPYHVM